MNLSSPRCFPCLLLGLLLALSALGSNGPALFLQSSKGPSKGQGLREQLRVFLAAGPADRALLADRLRALGPVAGEALLDILLARPGQGPYPSGSLGLLFEILPAQKSKAALALLPRMDAAGSRALLLWLARRDLEGFREHEAAKARGLLHFLDVGESLAIEAATSLANWDLALVAKGLAERLERGMQRKRSCSRVLMIRMARSFATLRACGPFIEDSLALAQLEAPWLLPLLIPALGYKPALVLAGRLDPWIRTQHPSLREAVSSVVLMVDNDLGNRLQHEERFALYRRFRGLEPAEAEWARREAHVAIFDLGRAEKADPALEVLGLLRQPATEIAEAFCLRAIADFLRGRDPSPALGKAIAAAEEAFAATPDLLSAQSEIDEPSDQRFYRLWRQQVPPRLGPRELDRRMRRREFAGGPAAQLARYAGRRRLAVYLLGALLNELDDKAKKNSSWLDKAELAYRQLNELHDDSGRFGPSRELDIALGLRSGPLELLTRALQGNEKIADGLSAAERKHQLAQAERGFRFLVRELAARLPEKVIGEPGGPKPAPRTDGEKAYADLTGGLARFLEVIGEEEKAIAVLDHLIQSLEGSGLAENKRAWASYLFNRASIAMDRRNSEIAEKHLMRYVRFYEDRLRDVRQNPELYGNPDAVRRFFAGLLANGYVSLAVLKNVVMGKLEEARNYCRKAYSLNDSPFNRVLYACYLARDGKAGEALRLMGRVDPERSLYYNMACTLAMCGRKSEAIHYVQEDLKWNHPTRKSRNRQRDWAAKDNDLRSLRDDPVFIDLIRQRKVGEEK